MFIHTNQPIEQHLTDRMTEHGRIYTTPEQRQYPSITTILGSGEKLWLEEWKASLGAERAAAETERAATRGTAVHDMVELYLKNDPDPCSKYHGPEVGLFNQIKMQLKRRVNNIRAQEIPLYSDALRVAGRVDCIADFDEVLSIIDFKTSTNNKRDDMIQDYYLQATAYAIMFYEMYGILIEQIVIIVAVERGIQSMVFTQPIFEYLEPLRKRITTYYKERELA